MGSSNGTHFAAKGLGLLGRDTREVVRSEIEISEVLASAQDRIDEDRGLAGSYEAGILRFHEWLTSKSAPHPLDDFS